MPRLLLVALVLVVLASAALAACATPGAPSGGPADTTPPQLARSRPASGATRVAADSLAGGTDLVLTFSERLDAATAARAVRVTPEDSVPPRVSVRGSDVVIALGALRDSTTYVVTVGTALADARGVALRAPLTLAFSTGDRVDRGAVTGVVRDPATGAPVAGLAVWATADTAAALGTTAPDYRTETDAAGAFRLDFLRPARYAVAVVADRNRNGRADADERFAAPPRRTLRATERAAARRDTSSAPSELTAGRDTSRTAAAPGPTFFLTRLDSVAPAPRLVRALSDRRAAVRFTEALRRVDARAFAVEDSASGRRIAATAYVNPEAPAEVFVVAAEALASVPHRVRLAETDFGVPADSSGAAVRPFARGFTPLARPDTVVARFVAFEPARDSARVLTPGQFAVLRWTAPPDSASLAARIRITERDGGAVPVVVALDGARVRVALPARGGVFDVSVVGTITGRPDSLRTARFTVLGPDGLGSIVGRLAGDVGGDGPVVVEASPGQTPFGPDAARATVGLDGAFEIAGLRPGPYRLRLFRDTDGDGAWSGGRLAPYVPPETLTFAAETATVRARWEADVGVLRLGEAPLSPAP